MYTTGDGDPPKERNWREFSGCSDDKPIWSNEQKKVEEKGSKGPSLHALWGLKAVEIVEITHIQHTDCSVSFGSAWHVTAKCLAGQNSLNYSTLLIDYVSSGIDVIIEHYDNVDDNCSTHNL